MSVIDRASGIDNVNPMVTMAGRTEDVRVLYIFMAAGVIMTLAGLVFWAGQRNAFASTVSLLCAIAVMGVMFLYWQRVHTMLAEDGLSSHFILVTWEGGFWVLSLSSALGLLASLSAMRFRHR